MIKPAIVNQIYVLKYNKFWWLAKIKFVKIIRSILGKKLIKKGSESQWNNYVEYELIK
jgi:hypothetical protein